MLRLKEHSVDFFKQQTFDALALGVVDFKNKSFSSFQLDREARRVREGAEPVYFDLASLSKPLINSLGAFSEPSRVGQEGRLLLDHRGGLPAWGLLPRRGWEDLIRSYPVRESSPLYSDFSALRFMLDFNQTQGDSLHRIASKTWDKEVLFWKELKSSHRTVQNGFIGGRPNFKAVHDPNAFNLDAEVSHAGLFGTIEGVCRTLLSFDAQHALLEKMERDLAGKHSRFVNGWDTVADPSNTLAGNGCGERVFGHLGFTGTSIWIDPLKKLGHVILSNATKTYWYDKKELNQFRKSLGEFVWSGPRF